ncbi:Calcium/calmodulin-dependent protein kinase kinase 1 [Talaromyces pinophilus]|nr:Calcium/calmodulin-dependent protein kinase kinase 1 [Talaromyces pinophilus]
MDAPRMASSPSPIRDTETEHTPTGPAKPARYTSSSSYESPRRHQHREPTAPRHVKETLNARSEYTTSQDDGTAQHRINQYIIKQEIGRGSFGAVHLAVDQYGSEYAVKEFSKARLRKRQQSHMLRRPRGPQRPGTGFNSPLHRHPSGTDEAQEGHPLDLIRQEIAIMKKLNHDNLVSLIEVLDDPTEDSLYMVMEMCKKGVIMKVGLDQKTDPYEDERCRLWFRDLILGIEYLHSQGIVHRDIKPDNCLLTSDDVLKVVDFGVSEMFAKDSDMYTAKSAGSPAFLPPELCVVKHGDVSGKAADIWSMGVTLYCLRYGRIPFEKQSIFELYESIRNDDFDLGNEQDGNFKDLMHRILEKDPTKRITMSELRNHPWVTKNGEDPLLPEEENTAQVIEPPTEEEMVSAITHNVENLFSVMKAVSKFKKLVDPSKTIPVMHSILGSEHDSYMVQPPLQIEPDEGIEALGVFKKVINENDLPRRSSTSTSQDSFSERGRSPKRHGSGVADKHSRSSFMRAAAAAAAAKSSSKEGSPSRSTSEGTRGHARDPLEEELPYLHIGPSTFTGDFTTDEDNNNGSINNEQSSTPTKPRPILSPLSVPDTSIDGIPEFPQTGTPIDTNEVPIISESPGASEIDIYETAYREEIERIKRRSIARRDSVRTRVYLTRRVENKKKHLDEVLKMVSSGAFASAAPHHQQSDNEQDQGSESVILHGVSDKVSGAFVSAGAAFSSALAAAKGASANISSTGTGSKEEIKDGESKCD